MILFCAFWLTHTGSMGKFAVTSTGAVQCTMLSYIGGATGLLHCLHAYNWTGPRPMGMAEKVRIALSATTESSTTLHGKSHGSDYNAHWTAHSFVPVLNFREEPRYPKAPWMLYVSN
ncbi:hypothetical protein EDB86DRAFT_924677 [Lactarius hatsudake]|nr:hypothetical protein EDB86DRAFT_924677 [Lactarius hatsudake]